MVKGQRMHEVAGRRVEELIFAELDDALTQEEERELHGHLAACEPCQRLRLRQRSLHAGLAGRRNDYRATARAEERVWRRLEEARTPGPPRVGADWRALLTLVAVALALFVGIGILVATRVDVASPVPEREEIAALAFVFTGGRGSLQVEQGRAAAHPRSDTGVLARTWLEFDAPTDGLAEIRVREPGQPSYGILARADLSGTRRASLEGRFPPLRPGESRTWELWTHLETASRVFASEPLAIEVVGTRQGERARPTQ